ncbi:MAG: ribosomal protein S18-alanine N-acetyltransferase [Caldilineaceae bacterium]|nr:ribosomal protein S18-alanine N-acetyltransferase [Caldilineaceae bacterium]
MTTSAQAPWGASRFTCLPMTVADLPQVDAIERQAFPAPRSASFYQQEVTQNRYAHYLVLHALAQATPSVSQVVAYGGYWLLGEDAHIVAIAVDPRWRRQGLAEWVMLELIAQAWQQEAYSVTLEMRVSNIAAQALYTKLGFLEVGRRKRYYRDNDEDAILFSLAGLQEPLQQQRLSARLAGLRLQGR